MKFYQNIFFSLVFIFGLVVPSMAQDDLPDEEVQVIKNFDARLQDADMLEVAPILPPSDPTVKPQSYNVESKTVQVQYLPPKIRPLALKREKQGEVFNGFLKAGVGLPNSFYGEAGYSVFKDKQFDFNFHAKHHSANNSKNIEGQKFAENALKLNGSYYFGEGFAVNGRIGYSRDLVQYYGYNFDEEIDTSFSNGQIAQRFKTFDIGASIFNGVQNLGDINYSADVDFYNLTDSYATRENGFTLKLAFTKWFNEKHPLGINVITDFNEFRDSSEQDLNNFYLQPHFTFVNERFRVKIGANVVPHNDEYSFFPQLEATVPVIGSRLTAFVGADGSLQKNTLRTMSEYNPFIGTRSGLVLRNTEFVDYYGGVKGNFSGFEYLGRIGYKQVEDLVLYNPNYAGINRTVVPYDFLNEFDDGNIFYINGSLTTPEFKGLSLLGNVSSRVYSMDNAEKAWHLPALTLDGTVKYKLLDGKASARASVFVENGVSYRTETGTAETLSGLFDLSVGADYQVMKNFGLFLDVYNLANNKRQRWANYPTYGINVLLGASAKF